MGTSAYNLQILGAGEEAVRSALPGAAVGRRSRRFVTACLGETGFRALNGIARRLSRELGCAVLAVSLFDGDVLDLTLFREGRQLAYYIADPVRDHVSSGAPGRFCEALGLPSETAPKLKRLFSSQNQEEKLLILGDLLGAPLHARWDLLDGLSFVRADGAALEAWLAEHPAVPKVKNRCRSRVIQEIAGLTAIPLGDAPSKLMPGHDAGGRYVVLLRPLRYADEETAAFLHCSAGDVIGHHTHGGFWGRPAGDGTLALSPAEDQHLPLPEGVLPSELHYTQWDDRLIVYGDRYATSGHVTAPYQTVILSDTAGLLPTPLALELEGVPARALLTPLPDGGFLAQSLETQDLTDGPPKTVCPAALCRYDASGVLRWVRPGDCRFITAVRRQGIYFWALYGAPPSLEAGLFHLDFDGRERSSRLIPAPCEAFYVLGDTPYLLLNNGYHVDAALCRLTPALQESGRVPVPYMSHIVLSPDGSLLYAAGFQSGLAAIDAGTFQVRRELRRRDGFESPVVDGDNRLWVKNGACWECYSPDLALLSRHRLAGEMCAVWPGPERSVCILTEQSSRRLIRVYQLG